MDGARGSERLGVQPCGRAIDIEGDRGSERLGIHACGRAIVEVARGELVAASVTATRTRALPPTRMLAVITNCDARFGVTLHMRYGRLNARRSVRAAARWEPYMYPLDTRRELNRSTTSPDMTRPRT